ncbi:MAG: bifunctional 4-hydroxy-2-oxoglutarate aldolase/2-dehydro-3-deoxy-phosphogluconate aldolase [Anaerolineae bacterium]|nr:bifunctional 4-hydroxy-2-oxoglutarate aldolase/2-dehydro-3-deoxy-phosphogluconate aldolase [Anaerolineae bacterium]
MTTTGLDQHRLFAVVRTETPDQALGVSHALIEAGVRLIEITLTIHDAIRVIQTLAHDTAGQPDVVIGAGSVVTVDQARAAIQAGARFLVSPVLRPPLVPIGQAAGVPVVLGGLTPTEALQAWEAGAAQVKVFPAGAMGGPGYVKDVLAPLPFLPIMVSGGVSADNMVAYLKAGARSVALGSSLMPTDLVRRGDWTGLTRHAQGVVHQLESAGLPPTARPVVLSAREAGRAG